MTVIILQRYTFFPNKKVILREVFSDEMPRTMLRYAIEKMSESERNQWMKIPADRFVGDYVVKANPFAGIPVPDFVDIIHPVRKLQELLT